ncbi:unnamed protein product [Dracunculus medinensis]|uniref:DNA polymerase alpha subunit B n=1 Tax=Dracunculus medinensis TaxID=318479 RepID=A0A3P7PSW8_DRAME|nr:unnamed protein product [Dracunculus medinensis]
MFTPIKNASSNIAYQERTGSGKALINYIGTSVIKSKSVVNHGKASVENLLSCTVLNELKYYGNIKEVEQIDEIFSLIELLKDAILANCDECVHFENCDHISSDEFAIYGQIIEETGEQLDFTNCFLQGNDEKGIPVRLNLEKLSDFSLFPGKIVAFRGFNENGSCFTPTLLYEPKLPKMAKITRVQQSKFEIWCAAGPFTSPHTFSFEQLYDLLELAKTELPDVLILVNTSQCLKVGPFIDRTSVASDSPDLNISFEEFFECLLINIGDMLSRQVNLIFIVNFRTNIQVVLVPNCRLDATAFPVFPTAPFMVSQDCHKLLNKNIIFATDPCMIRICGVVFVATGMDILRHLSREEIHRSDGGDRMARLIDHLIRQRSVYPLYPSSHEVPQMHARLIKWFTFKEIPHVLILPSALAPLVKVVNECICVNPSFLAKGNGGSFMKMFVDISQVNHSNPASIIDFCNVKVVRI